MKRSLTLVVLVGLAVCLPQVSRTAETEGLKPTNLKSVNTERDETDPHVSTNGLYLYYASGAKGQFSIRLSRRHSRAQSWPAGKPFAPLKGRGDSRSVFLTRDGKYPQYLYYASNYDPEQDARGDNFDIYFRIKQGPRSSFTEETPVYAVDTKADERDPWLTPDGRQLYFSRKDKDGWHVYVTKRKKGEQFGQPVALDFPAGFHHATLTPDGRTMYVQGPLDKGRWGLYRSMAAEGRWSKPEPLSALNSPDGPTGDQAPGLSRDGALLYFASDRPGGQGGLDLWVISTAKLKK